MQLLPLTQGNASLTAATILLQPAPKSPFPRILLLTYRLERRLLEAFILLHGIEQEPQQLSLLDPQETECAAPLSLVSYLILASLLRSVSFSTQAPELYHWFCCWFSNLPVLGLQVGRL